MGNKDHVEKILTSTVASLDYWAADRLDLHYAV